MGTALLLTCIFLTVKYQPSCECKKQNFIVVKEYSRRRKTGTSNDFKSNLQSQWTLLLFVCLLLHSFIASYSYNTCILMLYLVIIRSFETKQCTFFCSLKYNHYQLELSSKVQWDFKKRPHVGQGLKSMVEQASTRTGFNPQQWQTYQQTCLRVLN